MVGGKGMVEVEGSGHTGAHLRRGNQLDYISHLPLQPDQWDMSRSDVNI